MHTNTWPHPQILDQSHTPKPTKIHKKQALANSYAAAYYLFAPTTAAAPGAGTAAATAASAASASGSGNENPLAARLTLFEDKQQRLEAEASVYGVIFRGLVDRSDIQTPFLLLGCCVHRSNVLTGRHPTPTNQKHSPLTTSNTQNPAQTN
jgi:hypothetical protein